MDHETFLSLLKDSAHWEFEIFLMILFDGVIGAVLWGMILRPLWNKWFKHHKEDDGKLSDLERRLKVLEDEKKLREEMEQEFQKELEGELEEQWEPATKTTFKVV
jgi:hypothetical protein